MAELVAKRYASALFEVGVEDNTLDTFVEEFGALIGILKENGNFFNALKTPLIPKGEKKELLENVFKGKVNQQLLNFIKVLIDKDRVSVIELINVEFKKLSNEHKNTADAIAVTAIPLAPDKMEALKKQLSKITGKNVEITNVIDEEVMGGILVKIGNEEIDGTVKGRLGKLKEELHQIIA